MDADTPAGWQPGAAMTVGSLFQRGRGEGQGVRGDKGDA